MFFLFSRDGLTYECSITDIMKCASAGIPINNFIVTPTCKHECDNTHIIRQTHFNVSNCRTLLFRFDRVDGIHANKYHYQKLLPDDSIVLNDLYFAHLKSVVLHNNNHYICGTTIFNGEQIVFYDDLKQQANQCNMDAFLETDSSVTRVCDYYPDEITYFVYSVYFRNSSAKNKAAYLEAKELDNESSPHLSFPIASLDCEYF